MRYRRSRRGCHAHVLIGVATDTECDLIRIESVEEVYKKLETCQSLEGLGPDKWSIGSGWANSKAMELAGVTSAA